MLALQLKDNAEKNNNGRPLKHGGQGQRTRVLIQVLGDEVPGKQSQACIYQDFAQETNEGMVPGQVGNAKNMLHQQAMTIEFDICVFLSNKK